MKFSNMKIGSRLYLGFGLPMLLMVFLVAYSISSLGEIQGNLERIVKVNILRTGLTEEISKLTRENSIYLRNILLVKDQAQRQEEKKKIEATRLKSDEVFKKVEDLTPKGDEKARGIMAKVKGDQEKARGLNGKVIELALANKDGEATDLMLKEARPAVRKWLDSVDELVKYQEDRSKARYEASAAIYASTSLLLLIIGTITVLLTGGGAFLITRSITKPVSRVTAGLSEGAEQVVSASSQVSSASQSLAEGASEQAAGLEETSSSIEEMTSMTRQNADNANQANTLMAETSVVVEAANRSMTELTESMKEISHASEETAKIIKTIDEIAFQTNLLALNAAVEAARAGEAGAGFAVVADEVRNLALRAAEAAKNTANLIEGTVKKIKSGSDIVSKTNEAFGKVAGGSKKVGELVKEIAAASQEQAQGIEQINKAVAEMDKVVQQNAANAEESAAASEELNAQAEQMKAFVRDLAALVEGSGKGNGAAQGMAHLSDEAFSGKPAPIGHRVKGGVHKALKAPATQKKQENKGAGKGAAVLKSTAIKPDQVIPMGEGNFKEF